MVMLKRLSQYSALCLLALLASSPLPAQSRDTLPASLTDGEFWALTQTLSEPDGYFQSNSGSPDNLLSNETNLSTVAAALAGRAKAGGVYLGVGPEQNFSYIAAIRPRMAFITDIRRGNLQLHLLYKALFEMSAGREQFVARLFSRNAPTDLQEKSPAAFLMEAFYRVAPLDDAGFAANLKAVITHLTAKRKFPLSKDDVAGIEYVYRAFHQFGPDIVYTSTIGRQSGTRYASLMWSKDSVSGLERSYLAADSYFQVVKLMHEKNLIVPVVGDFAGPKALRAIGDYVRARGATVTAFYVSNVEDYLQRNSVWAAFCANVATFPLTEDSVFIRPGGRFGSFSPIAAETTGCK